MLAQGHTLSDIRNLPLPHRYHLNRLYLSREAGPLASARLLHAVYQLIQMIPKVMGAKNVEDIKFDDVVPALVDFVGQTAKPEDKVHKAFQNLKGRIDGAGSGHKQA